MVSACFQSGAACFKNKTKASAARHFNCHDNMRLSGIEEQEIKGEMKLL